MIDVIEWVCEPIRLILGIDQPAPEPGMIVQFIDDTSTCKISDGTRPFGIVANVESNGLCTVWFDTMVLRTDKYEDNTYKPGDSLYVSSRGYLTKEKLFDNSQLIGHVVCLMEDGMLEVNWI